MNFPFKKLALLAGQGDLPVKIIEHCQQYNIPFFVVAFTGQTSPALLKDIPYSSWHSLGEVGKILETLKAQQVDTVVMAGGMRRPSWSELKLDWTGTKWLAKVGLKSLGDDGLLTAVVNILESEGFKVISPSHLLSDLQVGDQTLTKLSPSDQDEKDIQLGQKILQTLGDLDIGQSIIIQRDIVLGIEAIEGTAALIQRCGFLKREGGGGVLVKMSKPHQNKLVDLPTIGPETIQQVSDAGLCGIAIEANTTQILDKEKVIQLANTLNLFIMAFSIQK